MTVLDLSHLNGLDAIDRMVIDHMERFHWSVTMVPDADPPFAYTTGLTLLDLPEVYISGLLGPQQAHALVNDTATTLSGDGGNPPPLRERWSGLLVGMDVLLLPMDVSATGAAEMNMTRRLFPEARLDRSGWLYPGVAAVQIVLPDRDGKLPTDEGFANDCGQVLHGRLSE